MPSSHPYDRQAIRSGILHFLSGRVIQGLLSVATVVVLVRAMAVEDYALYITCSALAAFLGSTSLIGIDRILTRYVPEARIRATPAQLMSFVRKVAAIRLLSLVGMFLVLLIFWSHISVRFRISQPALILPILSYALVHALLLFHSVLLQSLMLQRDLRNAAAIAGAVRLTILLAWVMATTTLKPNHALWIASASEAIGYVWMTFAASLHFRRMRAEAVAQKDASPWPADSRAVARFGAHNYLMGQASFPLHAHVQQLVAAALLSPTTVAGFGFFRNLSEQARSYLPFQLTRSITEPAITAHFVRNQDFTMMNAMTTALLKLNVLVIAPIASWLALAGSPVISYIADGKYSEQIWMLSLLLFGQLLATQVSLLVIAVNAMGLSRHLPGATIIAAVFTVLVLWIHIPTVGVVALVLSDITFGIITILYVSRAMRLAGYRYNFACRPLIRMFLTMAAIVATFWYAISSHWLAPNILSSIATGVAMCGLFWLGCAIHKPFTSVERDLLKRVVGRLPIPF